MAAIFTIGSSKKGNEFELYWYIFSFQTFYVFGTALVIYNDVKMTVNKAQFDIHN